MKVLFLDIDGVVNKQENFDRSKNPGPYPIDSYCAFLVGRIQLQTSCEVVLSSSWRHHPEGVQNVSERVVQLLDKTPTTHLYKYEDKPRGHEIKMWLDKHPEVEKYAILDDDSDMLDEQLPSFFQTSFKEGLTDEIAEKVIEHLGRI